MKSLCISLLKNNTNLIFKTERSVRQLTSSERCETHAADDIAPPHNIIYTNASGATANGKFSLFMHEVKGGVCNTV